MPVPDDLREILACPKCKGPLEYPDDRSIRCPACRLVYRVEGELPVMLVDEATPDEPVTKGPP